MNPNEIFVFISNLLREGAGTVTYVLLAFGAGLLAYRWLGRKEEARLAAELKLRDREVTDGRDRIEATCLRQGALQTERDALTARVARRDATIGEQRQRLIQARDLLAGVRQQRDLARAERDQARESCQQQAEEQSQLVTADQRALQQLELQIDEVLCGSGRVWERPPAAGHRPFRPLHQRRCPVIAVLNLKGGVGKTTLTVNVAARLGADAGRVLVIDLDHQRTLGTIGLHADDRERLHGHGHTVQHFLLGSDHTGARLGSFARPLSCVSNVSIVINTNPDYKVPDQTSLETVEERLYARWLLNRSSDGDPRTYLRDALQDDAIAGQYRYVLLDCPPRLSPSCVNAIAAADFVLVPIYLDRTSTNSLLYMLRELSRLRTNPVFSHLRVLGVVANGVHGGTIPGVYRPLWNELEGECRGAWGEPVHRFSAAIRRSAELGHAANDSRETGYHPPALGDLPVADDFRNLVDEMTRRIEHESQQPASVPA